MPGKQPDDGGGDQQTRKGTLILNANVSVLAAQKTEQNQGKNNAQGPKRAANAKKAARGLPTTGSAGSLPLTELALLGLVVPAVAVAIRRRDN